MAQDPSSRLSELPGFLSTVSMVVDDRSEIVKSLRRAEQKSPSIYQPARDLYRRVLQGDLSFDQAWLQSQRLTDETQKQCCIEVLLASKNFLCNQTPARIATLPTFIHSLPNNMELAVAPILLRYTSPPRLMVLHFWRKPLSPWQLSAASAIIKRCINADETSYSNYGIDFIAVSIPKSATSRRFENRDWTHLSPLNQRELDRFWSTFIAGWNLYIESSDNSRKGRRRRDRELFDL